MNLTLPLALETNHLFLQIVNKILLGAVHKCQYFHECTNHILPGGGGGGGLWKSTFFPCTFNFLAWFLLFSWGFLALKKRSCALLFWGEGFQKVHGVYTHENVEIYGWPLSVPWMGHQHLFLGCSLAFTALISCGQWVGHWWVGESISQNWVLMLLPTFHQKNGLACDIHLWKWITWWFWGIFVDSK